MEQQNDQKVIYLIQTPKKVDIRDVYNAKAVTVLGVVHIICGLIALASEIIVLVSGNVSFAAGIWTSVFFFTAGGLAIGGARTGNKCLVIATLVMAIFSAVFAGALIILTAIESSLFQYYGNGCCHWYLHEYVIASYVLLITMRTTLLATAITLASLTCLPLCCRSAEQDMVQLDTKAIKEHQQPNEANVTSVVVNMEQWAALNVPTIEDLQERSTPPSRIVSDSSEPPSFLDVAGLGSKYQKF